MAAVRPRRTLGMRWMVACCCCFALAGCSSDTGSSIKYRVKHRNGTECVAADFTGAVFNIPYPCRSGACAVAVALPPANWSRSDGRCDNQMARLEVAWSEGRFKLELEFRQRTFQTVWAQVKAENVTYGYVSKIQLLADLRDPVFVNASIEKGDSPQILEFWRQEESGRLLLFAAPANSAFVCASAEEVRLWPRHRREGDGSVEAVATFPAVQLTLSLGGGAGEKPHDGAFLCEADSKRHRSGIVAIVIAGVIGACMLVIVIGYLVTRLNKSSRYGNLE